MSDSALEKPKRSCPEPAKGNGSSSSRKGCPSMLQRRREPRRSILQWYFFWGRTAECASTRTGVSALNRPVSTNPALRSPWRAAICCASACSWVNERELSSSRTMAERVLLQPPWISSYPERWSTPLPNTSTRMSPSAEEARASKSITTLGGSLALSQSAFFLTPGEKSSPATVRHWPPVEK